MRRVLVERPGEPPVVRDGPPPAPGPGEVTVELLAAPITPLDLLCASGTSYFGVPATPYVPGVQGVGRVDGRPVWFPTTAGMRPGDGSMAELATAVAADLVELPEAADPVAVAAAGLSAVAAHACLHARGGLVAGETVLVLGAGGVVGLSAVRFARAAGARVVAGARSPAARARAGSAGADVVVGLDGDLDELAASLTDACDGGADLVIDPLFGVPAAAALRALHPGGRMVHLGSSAGDTSPIDSATLRSGSLRVIGYTNNELSRAERAATLGAVATAVAEGTLELPHERRPLDDAGAAWQRQATGSTDGRIVLVP
ncbi:MULTISPECIES: quinone oxidoreductase family protein [Pseudonocardia]|uniref:Phthiocerol synthesis polyketide synthase type I PpsC n=2 Tax=Pseudonocardia TaxID=1847 RepID=A0A1Y2N4C1_PSEAH|nr:MULTISPECIES: zinc-binding alcohol dehydrogenase family protein [Pseudonocardia]OSY42324.1 Phthiocerol synthesis polyketide synthase type I PpsC [Pseudonocardia autotrophica]TDN75844.1 NADPH:quinone reductase-like Zn-dependent oxidoreductase [Pseudonocardia autotrophica]BBF99815.1 NADPH:quinone reductase [Pseudonocardia autotrophica]GEC27599.1 NADPH:quinone reductase [Pseudonocardia saturnea]